MPRKRWSQKYQSKTGKSKHGHKKINSVKKYELKRSKNIELSFNSLSNSILKIIAADTTTTAYEKQKKRHSCKKCRNTISYHDAIKAAFGLLNG